MTDKTYQEVKEEHQRRESSIALDVMDTYAEIGTEDLEHGLYLDKLTPEQRRALLSEQRGEKAREAKTRGDEEVRAGRERFAGEVRELRRAFGERLFGNPGTEMAELLDRMQGASEEKLTSRLALAIKTSNKELGRAVFAVADERGRGDLLNRYFSEVDPEAASVYEQWRALPSEEDLERQIENAERVIPEATEHQLMPRPRVPA
jgi:hypothetical protein